MLRLRTSFLILSSCAAVAAGCGRTGAAAAKTDAAPLPIAVTTVEAHEVRRAIGRVEGVAEVHDLHVWSITSGLHALSAHVVVSDPARDQHAVLEAIQTRLRSDYDIDHSTLQIETRQLEDCGSC